MFLHHVSVDSYVAGASCLVTHVQGLASRTKWYLYVTHVQGLASRTFQKVSKQLIIHHVRLKQTRRHQGSSNETHIMWRNPPGLQYDLFLPEQCR